MSDLQKHINQRLKDEAFKNTWEENKLEMEVAKQLISLRKSLGVTQSELAKRLNTKQSAISRIEKGEQNISIALLEKIAVALGGEVNISISSSHQSNESSSKVIGQINSQQPGGSVNQPGGSSPNIFGSTNNN